jgi:hypothetical protein
MNNELDDFFSSRERDLLGRKHRIVPEPFDLVDLILAAIIAGLILGVLISAWMLTDTVEAHELPKTDKDYCSEFLEGKWNVTEEDRAGIAEYCHGI